MGGEKIWMNEYPPNRAHIQLIFEIPPMFNFFKHIKWIKINYIQRNIIKHTKLFWGIVFILIYDQYLNFNQLVINGWRVIPIYFMFN